MKLIAAASDGYVNVTPEKCERIRTMIDIFALKARLEQTVKLAAWEGHHVAKESIECPWCDELWDLERQINGEKP